MSVATADLVSVATADRNLSSELCTGACDTEGSSRGESDTCSAGAVGTVAGIDVAFGGEILCVRVGLSPCGGSLSERSVGSGFDGGACSGVGEGDLSFGVGEGDLSLGVASSFGGGGRGAAFFGDDCGCGCFGVAIAFGVGEGEQPLGVAPGFDGGCGDGAFSGGGASPVNGGGASPVSCGGCCGSACCCG